MSLLQEWIGDGLNEAPMGRQPGKRRGEETNYSSGKKARTSGQDYGIADDVHAGAQVFAEISGYYDEDQEAAYGEVLLYSDGLGPHFGVTYAFRTFENYTLSGSQH